ncbi:MAG TPA: polysaccharide biosynthesis/export family protein [Pyrinomonadaceae bacterium]|jgi:protein involved in polysaccharide export with SLBB domain|nr:polysaccharide biosynthesis/export family protein [Pyrinomonadaceae bacterium]
MKNSILAAAILSVAFAVTAAAQVNPAISVVNSPVTKSVTNKSEARPEPAKATRARVLNPTQNSPATNSQNGSAQSLQAHAKANFKNRARLESLPAEVSTENNGAVGSVTTSTAAGEASKVIAPKLIAAPNSNLSNNVHAVAPLPATLSQIYRVDVGDVLDIQLNNNPSQESTLFTVLSGGLLEYPLAGSPVPVAGMTTAEIATTLRAKIKLFEDPEVVVNVRDYASHTVTISGFVGAPGTKMLRREAVPLYTLLAESLVLPDAARATVTRSTGTIFIDLNDANLSATLVQPGDVIKVLGPVAATEFFFVGGEVKLPGQKAYHSGLTLTQAILAAGGATNNGADRVRVSRQGTDGRLVTEEFNLRKILDGKLADPVLHKDDRIELTTAN